MGSISITRTQYKNTVYLRLGGDQPPEVWMLLIIWLKEVEVRVCSLLDSQNKLGLTTSLPHKLCSLQDDLQAVPSQKSVFAKQAYCRKTVCKQ